MRVLIAALLLAGCGAIIDEPPPPDPGRPCTQDTDCVPNGCCGMAGSAIHQADAPDCSTVQCSGMCPVTQTNCGCGVPICRDSRCSVAVATGPGCE